MLKTDRSTFFPYENDQRESRISFDRSPLFLLYFSPSPCPNGGREKKGEKENEKENERKIERQKNKRHVEENDFDRTATQFQCEINRHRPAPCVSRICSS